MKSSICLKIAFFTFTLPTPHIFLYSSIFDRIIKYFPNMISLKKAAKAVFGKKHLWLWLKGKQKCWMALLPVYRYFTVVVLHPKCSQCWEGKPLLITGVTGLWENDTDAVVSLILMSFTQKAKLSFTWESFLLFYYLVGMIIHKFFIIDRKLLCVVPFPVWIKLLLFSFFSSIYPSVTF